VGPGAWDIGGVVAAPVEPEPEVEEEGDPDEAEEWPEDLPNIPELKCRLVHAAPPVGFRVLCVMPGPDEQQKLERAFAFLLASERAPDGADLHVEIGGPSYASFKARMGEVWDARSAQNPKLDGAEHITGMLTDVGRALAGHERATFDVSFVGDRAVLELGLAYPDASTSSGFRAWLDHASGAKLPSAANRLPSDSGFALAFSGLGRDATSHVLSELEAETEEDHDVDPKRLTELTTALAGVVPVDSHFALAIGFDADAASSALHSDSVRIADETDKPLSAAAVKQLQAALGGWTVFGLDVPPERYLPAVQRLYLIRNLKLPYKPGKARPSLSASSEYRVAAVPRGLPKGTLSFVERSRRTRKLPDGVTSPPLDFDRHLLFVPDGSRVWIVVSRNPKVAVRRAQLLLEHRESFVWARAPGASPVVESSFDLRSLLAFALDWDTKEQRAAARASLSRVNQAPNSAGLRIPLRLDVVKGDAEHRLRMQSELNLSDLFAQAVALAPLPSSTPGDD
jgi:hypothetical protein